MSLKRKTPPTDDIDDVPALTPSTTASRPSSTASSSRPASSNGDVNEPVVAAKRRASASAATPNNNAVPKPPRRRSIAPAPPAQPAQPAQPVLPRPPTIQPAQKPPKAQAKTASASAAPAPAAAQSLIVPEILHARLQHAAFPHAISLVPAPPPAANVLPGQPPNGRTGTTGGTGGNPGTSTVTGTSAITGNGAGNGNINSDPLVIGQVLYQGRQGVISSSLSSRNSLSLNRAAVLAAAERSGVKALHGLPSVNALWHIASFVWEGALPVHAIMDGYSRRLLALRAGESNNPKVVATLFRDTVKAIGCYPARVRAGENEAVVYVKERMRGLRGKQRGSFIHGPPESNEHLFPIWDLVRASQPVAALAGALRKHAADGLLDKHDALDRLAVQVAYLPPLNAALDLVRKEWNKSMIDGCGMSHDAVWALNIQEWAKRGRYPGSEPETVDLPREALAQHSAEEFVNYGATGGPYIPCSVNALLLPTGVNKAGSTDGLDLDILEVLEANVNASQPPSIPSVLSFHSAPSVQSAQSIQSAPSTQSAPSIQSAPSVVDSPSVAPPSPSPPAPFAHAPLDDIAAIDPCLRVWLEDFPLPKSMGYAAVRVAMGEYLAREFGHVAIRFRVGRDRLGQ